ncbi:MAG TPA: hypothetical protein VKT71_03545 [Candidatus Acidoferrales bacterium]|nr:hypothetical protein [Candidatus Acidoferrales bacterium]
MRSAARQLRPAAALLGFSGKKIVEGLLEGRYGVSGRARVQPYAEEDPGFETRLKGAGLEHHRRMLKQLPSDLDAVDTRALPIEQQIVEAGQAIRGSDPAALHDSRSEYHHGWTIVAEIGVDMSPFPDADHLASWAELCPG